MRAVVWMPVAALAAAWIVSLWLWPQLPARFPVHFDLAGAPDRWSDRSLGEWLLLPALATAFGLGLGVLLPKWIARLAATNSPSLNVPHKQRFAELSPAARVRAVQPVATMLRLIASELALLFAAIQYGSVQVAVGAWPVLPPALAWIAVPLLLATALASIPFVGRAVQRELRSA